ncbi:MAG: DUF423 domain-containing protein [Pseudomonadales bacterium]|nr:DUF423 domain-containing protein [Pseudomonadales bacterium]
MQASLFIQIAAFSGFLAVGLGAFGAHGLKNKLTAEMMAVFQTAVLYHFLHTLVLLAVALLMLHWGKSSLLLTSAWSLVAGLILFSGSLYMLSFTGIKILGAITPIGGVAFLIAWATLFFAAFKAS